ncbi:SIR2 family protein [Mucilaginibacter sp. 14171R-50]|uniref:SIR2 family protein n=1 Tax=Mucilaginibacter sp. 14171R-50 TaxID=2703789 RepID=UPI00138C7B03|nr:SIR2 family protein [Mucilaginibacter sp. 14171R-50]QHS55456.1 SIR2 family protein [Mucilaginibacter sp. 14171R-50]
MNISEFISQYKNHPVLFIGTGFSLRYLRNSYTWDGLLAKIAFDLKGNNEYYLDIKASSEENGKYKFEMISSKLEMEFNRQLQEERNGKFKDINDIFYENMAKGVNLSRFKIYISQIFSTLDFRPEKADELSELKKIRKNISSIITTNYDNLIEQTFEFNKLIGNDILLSNPYGSVYKIHGCRTLPGKLIITTEDYQIFFQKYELIRAQLLSLFIHNPIIFFGYSIGDENIKSILKTIFTYIEPNSEQAKKIRANFLLVEYDSGSMSNEIVEHDIDMEGFSTIRINKIRTDNFSAIYNSISSLQLPISAMDVRKVQAVVKEIYSGGNIAVKITEDLDLLGNAAKILAIGTDRTIKYDYLTSSETLANYFKLIDEANSQTVGLIDKYVIPKTQYFPIYGFNLINANLTSAAALKENQKIKIQGYLADVPAACQTLHATVQGILDDNSVPKSSKSRAIFWSIMNDKVSIEDTEKYLRDYNNKKNTEFKRMLSAYDFKKFSKE